MSPLLGVRKMKARNDTGFAIVPPMKAEAAWQASKLVAAFKGALCMKPHKIS